MNANPAPHPQALDLYPDTAPAAPQRGNGGEAVGPDQLKAQVKDRVKARVKNGVESVPCSIHFDRTEARTYAGLPAADLVEHAKDIEAMQLEKPLRMGSTARFQERVAEFTDGVLMKALNAYIMVKNAVRLIA